MFIAELTNTLLVSALCRPACFKLSGETITGCYASFPTIYIEIHSVPLFSGFCRAVHLPGIMPSCERVWMILAF